MQMDSYSTGRKCIEASGLGLWLCFTTQSELAATT